MRKPDRPRNRFFNPEEVNKFKTYAHAYFVCDNCDRWYALDPDKAPKRCGCCLKDNRWRYVPEMTGEIHGHFMRFCKAAKLVTNHENFKRYFESNEATAQRERFIASQKKEETPEEKFEAFKDEENPALKGKGDDEPGIGILDLDGGFILPEPEGAEEKTYDINCFICGVDYKKRTTKDLYGMNSAEMICPECVAEGRKKPKAIPKVKAPPKIKRKRRKRRKCKTS